MTTRLILVCLGVLLLLTILSHPVRRRLFLEGFTLPNFSQPSIDLSKNANFMTFLAFHQQVCTIWDEIVTEVMKNDQVSQPINERLPKEKYMAQLAFQYSSTAKFIQCKPFDQTSPLSVLLESIPDTTQVYKDTFAFLNKELSDTLQKLHDALDSTNVSVSHFANYEPFADCKAEVAVAVANATAAAAVSPSPSVQTLQMQQQTQTTQVLNRIHTILVELPALQTALQSVSAQYKTLKDYKKKGESGEIFSEVH